MSDRQARIPLTPEHVSPGRWQSHLIVEVPPSFFGSRYRLNSSRSRFVCARLTGISVWRLSFMRNW